MPPSVSPNATTGSDGVLGADCPRRRAQCYSQRRARPQPLRTPDGRPRRLPPQHPLRPQGQLDARPGEFAPGPGRQRRLQFCRRDRGGAQGRLHPGPDRLHRRRQERRRDRPGGRARPQSPREARGEPSARCRAIGKDGQARGVARKRMWMQEHPNIHRDEGAKSSACRSATRGGCSSRWRSSGLEVVGSTSVGSRSPPSSAVTAAERMVARPRTEGGRPRCNTGIWAAARISYDGGPEPDVAPTRHRVRAAAPTGLR